MTSAHRPVPYSCPYCEERNLETVATATYVRGMLVAHQIGHDTFIGCVSCVREKLMSQAGLSLLIGWFSLMSMLLNPVLILLNIFRTPFIRVDYQAVREKLQELGIPENPSQVDITAMCYSLAASMMAVDGHIDPTEVETATRIGKQLLEDFEEEVFYAQFKNTIYVARSKEKHVLLIETRYSLQIALLALAFSRR